MTVGDFTDFECSHHHARRMNRLMSHKDAPRNGFFLPRAYHGRSSSVVVSDEPVYLPWGQTAPDDETPTYRACERFDYELELGIVIGAGNTRGHPISVENAEDHIFGFCIINDWSARDIQRWERLPLGPFNAKNHQTFVSPWIVTFEALAPFRAPHVQQIEGRPERPLPHLDRAKDAECGALDIGFKITLSTEKMRAEHLPAVETSTNTFLDSSWSLSQIVAHHTAGGCNLRPGDLIGSGTISGEADHASACLMELTELGRKPLVLPNGETRGFLEYGDEVTFSAASETAGYPRIGFGTCRGRVQKAPMSQNNS
jgi:fumarylacetoacetase